MEFKEVSKSLGANEIGIDSEKRKPIGRTVVEEFLVRIEPIIGSEPELRVATDRNAGEIIVPIRFDIVFESDDTVEQRLFIDTAIDVWVVAGFSGSIIEIVDDFSHAPCRECAAEHEIEFVA